MNYDRKDFKELRLANASVETSSDDKMVVSGYAAVFDQQTLIGSEDDGFYEVIDRNAFVDCDMNDCALKYNHGDAKGILARTRNGSLQIKTDEYGLFIRAELIDTTDNVDIYKCIKAGLLDKMSFAFTVKDQIVDRSSNPIMRTITKIDKLWDCAVVDVPAYDGTSIYARSKKILERTFENSEPKLESFEASLERDEKIKELELRKRKFKFKNNLNKEDK